MADNSSITQMSVDDYFQSTAIGSVDRAIANNLYGINHTQQSGFVPMNKDQHGFVFLTRPQLNLQSDNIRNRREFYPLLSERADSIGRYVRTMLDPRLQYGYVHPAASQKKRLVNFNYESQQPIASPFCDKQNIFIPSFTNNITAASGFPDLVAPTWSAKPGLYDEGYGLIDGAFRNYTEYDIDLTLRNTRGDPNLYMAYIWQLYASMAFEGLVQPYIDMITEREIDYNTRIYRLVMDETKTYVTKIMCTGAAYPISVPIGSMFDFNADEVYNLQNKTFTIRFKCYGAVYFDPIIPKWFNDAVIMFCPGMADNNRGGYMTKVNRASANLFRGRCYPRINPDNYELEWWVPNDVFSARANAFLKQSTPT